MSIEEVRRLVLEQARIVAAGLDHPDTILAAADAYALAVLDEIEGAALRSASVEVNDHFVDDAIAPLRRRIEAPGG